MDPKDHLELMRSVGQLEEGQKSLGHRVTDFEKRMFDEFKRLREDFKTGLSDVVSEMRRNHDAHDTDGRAIEKRVESLEREGSHHDGAWSVGSRTLTGIGMILITALNAIFAWVSAHAGK